MTEEQKPIRVSDMLRMTAGNTHNLMVQIAEHIDKLESEILALGQRINELEGNSDANRKPE